MRELILLLAAVLIHEAGHLSAARLLKIPLISFRLNPAGGIMTFDFSHTSYLREAVVHLSGPAAGLLAAFAGYKISDDVFFTGISITLSLVNLLPIDGLDGGGILRCVLNGFCPPEIVWRIGQIVSMAGVCLLWTAVLWIELRVTANVGLLAFAVYLLMRNVKLPAETKDKSRRRM